MTNFCFRNSIVKSKAFSLIELSIVVLIIGILIAGVTQGSRLVRQSQQKTAQALTSSSAVASIPGLVLWLEPTLDGSITSASNGSNPEDGDRISSWNDINPQLISKINLTQATQANQPTYQVNGINNLPSIRFNNNILYSMVAPITAHNSNYTMIAVWSSFSLPDSILMEQRPANFGTFLAYGVLWLNVSSLRFAGWNDDSGALATINTGKNYINIMVVNNTLSNNIINYFNSNTAVTNATSPSGPSALDLGNYIFSVGGRTNSPITTYSYLSNILLSEVIIFDRALKKSEVTDINNYLSKKYGIALS